MVSTRTGRKSSIDSAGSKASSPRAPPSSKKPASAKKSASKKAPKPPKEPEEAEEEEELEPLWFDDGQREAPAAPEEDASDDDASDGGDAPSAFFVDTAPADEGAEIVRVDFLGRQEELEPGAYFGAVARGVAAAKLEMLRRVGADAARALDADDAASSSDDERAPAAAPRADRESRYVDFDALEIRGDALAAAGGTADAALARAAAAVPAGPKKRRSKSDKAAAPATAGPGWFDMARSEKTAVSELDAKALAFRGVTDPKRFYKKHDALSPFAQIGTVVAGAFEGRGQTLRRKDRKTSLMGELLGDETKRAYAKRKFTQIQDKARGPGNARLKGKKKHAHKKRG